MDHRDPTSPSSEGSADARAILRLAVPALGALVAQPLYVLVDTAVVGHLGTPQLGGLGVASTILLTAYAVFVFLAYGTTGSVARLIGAGDERGAAHLAVQGLWFAGGLAVVTMAAVWLLGARLIDLLGPEAEVAANAEVYLRVAVLGLPGVLVTMAGTGYLRGVQDARTPLVVAVATSVLNLVLLLVLVQGLDRGIGASALATVVAQSVGGAVYAGKVIAGARRAGAALGPDRVALRRLATIGGDLLVRTAALRLSLAATTAVAARLGVVPVAAHQVTFEVLAFLSLALDALAIAAQALVGNDLGAGAADRAMATARRILVWSFGCGAACAALVVVVRIPLAGVFSDDPAVEALTAELLLWLAVLLVPAGVVFGLDGVLIGAGDNRYLAWAMAGAAAVFVPLAGGVLALDLTIGWLWAALVVLFLLRLGPLLVRFRRGAWLVLGADAP